MKVFKVPTVSEMLSREEAFFDKTFMMSYSGLNKLIHSPKLFYLHYLLGQKEDKVDISLLEGKLIHCLLLNPEDFDKEFVLMATDIPSDNPKELLHRLYAHYKELKESGDTREELHEFSDAIIDILSDMNLYQNLVDDKKKVGLTGDQKRLEKILTDKYISYWSYLKNREGKENIDHSIYVFAQDVVEQIKQNTNIMRIMGEVTEDMSHKITVKNEMELVMIDEKYMFGLRGFIDNLVIDYRHKVIRVNDLKKTSKTIDTFVDSISFYRYWIQAAIYKKLVENVFLNKPEFKDFSFEFRFIVVDNYLQVAPIKVSNETMEKWIEQTEQLLDKANYHFVNKNFDLPYEFLIEEYCI